MVVTGAGSKVHVGVKTKIHNQCFHLAMVSTRPAGVRERTLKINHRKLKQVPQCTPVLPTIFPALF